MELYLSYVTGIVIIVGLCIRRGYKRWERNYEKEITYTLTCMDCDGQDFKEKDDCYQCLDCGTKTRK